MLVSSLLALLLLAVLISAACRGEQDTATRVLQLKSGPVTEQQLKSSFRAINRNDPREMEKLCDQILLDQIGDVAILDTLRELGLGIATVTPAEPIPTDIARAAEIVSEECARLRNE